MAIAHRLGLRFGAFDGRLDIRFDGSEEQSLEFDHGVLVRWGPPTNAPPRLVLEAAPGTRLPRRTGQRTAALAAQQWRLASGDASPVGALPFGPWTPNRPSRGPGVPGADMVFGFVLTQTPFGDTAVTMRIAAARLVSSRPGLDGCEATVELPLDALLDDRGGVADDVSVFCHPKAACSGALDVLMFLLGASQELDPMTRPLSQTYLEAHLWLRELTQRNALALLWEAVHG